MTDIVIANGIVITMDKQRRVIDDGAVAIKGDRIVAVGPTAEVTRAHRGAKTIDARRKVVMPGLIDSHAHAGHGLVKSMGGGRSDEWYKACETIYTTGSSEEFWYAEAALSALERLKFGTTCGVSFLGGGDSIMRVDEPGYGERHCDAVDAVGIRSFVAVGPCSPPFPRNFARWNGKGRQDHAVSFDRQLETCETLIQRRHGKGSGRVHISMCFPVHGPESFAAGADKALVKSQARATHELGRKHGVRFTQDGHKRGTIATSGELGLLGPDAYLSHCIEMTPQEIALCRETGTNIVHNPSAHMSIRGRCPVPELIEAGVNVAIGSDGTAPDRSFDMFRHMFQCMHYHRTYFHDSSYLPPGKVMEMVTIDAARALGLEKEIGSLETGKKADVILIDMFKPHLYPPNMPVYRVACFASGADVDTVIVDGKVLMEGRAVRTVDEGEILDMAAREAETMLDRTGLRPLLADPQHLWNSSRY